MSNILDNEIAATEEVLSGESSVVASPIKAYCPVCKVSTPHHVLANNSKRCGICSAEGRTIQQRANRADIHRPSAIIPEDYQFVCLQVPAAPDLEACLAVLEERKILEAHKARTGGKFSHHSHGGSCHVCGADAVYMVVYYHAATNSYIKTGFDCAQKMDMSTGHFNQFKKAVLDAREAQAGKRKAQALLGDAGLSRCWDLAVAESRDAYQWEENTICDIVGKLVHYGSISDKQKSFLGVLLNKIDNRAAIQAQRAAESDAAAPCPTGRVKISGTVLSVKVVEGSFGDVTKILVKSDTGFKVWGSRFSITGTDGGVQKDQHVEFVATVEPSKDDPKFGFFKRPVVSLPELSAEDKKAVRMLKRISKRMVYGNDTCAAIGLIDGLAQTIKNPYDEYTREQLARWNS